MECDLRFSKYNRQAYVWTFFALLLVSFLEECKTSSILALIPYSGKSHYIFQNVILEELALRGHNVTVVTSFETKNPVNENYKQILVDKSSMWDVHGKGKSPSAVVDGMTPVTNLIYIWDAGIYMTNVTLNSNSIRGLIADNTSKFDLVISEIFFQEALYAFAQKFDAPLVTFCTFSRIFHGDIQIGNPTMSSYLPHELLPTSGEMTIYRRVVNTMFHIFDAIGRKYYYIPQQEKLIQHYFSKHMAPLENIADLEKRVVLTLRNSHLSWDRIAPALPNVIDIAGAQLFKPVNQLPKDILNFIKESKHGVIYFCLGSNIKSVDMKPEIKSAFINVFSQRKERVIWKFEDNNVDLPSNILIRPWFPQVDILAHPKVELFITHGGLHSLHEALFHAVPILGIPMYGDQEANLIKVTEKGIGEYIKLGNLDQESLNKTINKILDNPSYKANMRITSRTFRDRPMTALDTAIYWIEYVINNKHTDFSKLNFRDIPWYQYYSLDIFTVLFTGAIAISSILFKMFKLIVFIIYKKDNTNRIKKLN